MPRSAIVWGNYDSLIDKNIKKYNKSGRIVSEYERKQILYRLVLYQLYKRYIKPYSAEFEINISSVNRKRLVNLMNNYEVWMSNDYNLSVMNAAQLATLFEECKQEQFRLLLSSFARYKTKSEFKNIQEYYSNKFELIRKKERKESKQKQKNNNKNSNTDNIDNSDDVKQFDDDVKDNGLVLVDGATPNYDDDDDDDRTTNNAQKQGLMAAKKEVAAIVQSDSEPPR